MDKNGHETYLLQLQKLLQLCLSQRDIVSIDGAYKFVNMTWAVPRSVRTDFEMIYVMSGTAHLEFHGRSYTARKGEVFLVDNAEGNFCKSGNFSLLFCTFSVSAPSNSWFYQEITNCFALLHGCVAMQREKEFEQLFLMMIKDFLLKQNLYKQNVHLILMQMWIELCREIEQHVGKQAVYVNRKHDHMVKEIQSFLWDHLSENTPIADIAARWNISPRFVNRIFKKLTGYPIAQFRKRLRIDLSKQLLREKDIRITDISEQLGFANSQHFNRAFRQITRMTPSEYKHGEMDAK